ncbi:MAG: ComF family protein [Deltaproteobacteria bacterium]|nr:ComF family protein [Deltaproteobacteria bacterium]
MRAAAVIKTIVDVILPPVCALCGNDVRRDRLCRGCEALLESMAIQPPFCRVCGIPFVSGSSTPHTCALCCIGTPPFIAARSAFVYDACALDAIHAFKYNGRVALARALGAFAAQASPCLCDGRPNVVMPVPLHKARLKERGFNQSLLIAREISRLQKTPLDYANLRRIRPTDQQVRLSAKERPKNVKGAFALERPDMVRGKAVLLVDDVYTTGATIRECAAALNRAGAKVFAVTLARAVKL